MAMVAILKCMHAALASAVCPAIAFAAENVPSQAQITLKGHNQPSHCVRKARPLHGFTLVELLVVVAIIAVLIAMLLPAMNKARQSAQAIACQSNLHQIGIMMHTYASDNNGLLPGILFNREGASVDVTDRTRPANWKQRLQPAIDANPRIYECPAETGLVELPFQKTSAKYYAMNMYLVRLPDPEPWSTGRLHDNYWKNKRLASVKFNTEAGLVLEARRSEQIGSTYAVIPGTSALSRLADLERHFGSQSNVLMVDGHAESRRPDEIDLPKDRWPVFWEGR